MFSGGAGISKPYTIIISDLHAGAPSSLLTVLDQDTYKTIPHQISVATQTFAKALSATLKNLNLDQKPNLVLLGDVMDFSLAPPQVSAEILKNFFYQINIKDNFGSVFFVPGNHDHELWTAERYGATTSSGADPTKADFWAHTSPAFAKPDAVGTTKILNQILARTGYSGEIATYYPNMGMTPRGGVSSENGRSVILHHGHYIEDAYKLMTRILAALADNSAPRMTAENLERVNGSWIDFAWSTLGDDGKFGQEISLTERLMQTGGAAHAFQDRLAHILAQQLAATLPLPSSNESSDILDHFSKGLIDTFIGAYSQLERYSYTEYLSLASQQGLHDYLAQVVMAQIDSVQPPDERPDRISFVFGHTHKPFADQIIVDGFNYPVPVYNTGGWVVDTSLLSTVEGAAVVFVDDQMNAAMLQLYSMGEDQSDDAGHRITKASVTTADLGPDESNPMYQSLSGAVDTARPEWDNFQTYVQVDILIKQNMYLSLGAKAEKRQGSAGVVR